MTVRRKPRGRKLTPVTNFIEIASGRAAWAKARQAEGGRHGLACAKAQREARAKDAIVKRKVATSLKWHGHRDRYGFKPAVYLVVTLMREGAWYALADIRALVPAAPGGTVKNWMHTEGIKYGLFERALNSEFDAAVHPNRQCEPRYLFRLSVEAVNWAREWRLGVSEGGDTAETG